MTKNNLKQLVIAGVLACTVHQAQAISLDFSSLGGTIETRSQLEFNGTALDDTFNFRRALAGANLGYSFKIISSDGIGDSVDDLGRIQKSASDTSQAVFTIGNVVMGPGGVQTAIVTGSGYMMIRDKNGQFLTGTLTWDTIQTQGTAGNVNMLGAVNLKNIIYFGTEQDLIDLSNTINGWASATFQFGFNPGKTLTQLKATGAYHTTSFTGDITAEQVPDGGSLIGMMGLGFLALGVLKRRFA